ncbi:MAG: hypothetical protein LBW85_02270 [Deltaproteobacteria bacterium]|jgi:hypothetical protein|nr:hypothetical protein [Deltaproteobacteria bacterium]
MSVMVRAWMSRNPLLACLALLAALALAPALAQDTARAGPVAGAPSAPRSGDPAARQGEARFERIVLGQGASRRARLLSHSTDVYTVRFTGGAEATARAETEARVFLFVFDSADNMIAFHTGSGEGPAACSWTPAETADYTVRVVNMGEFSADYTFSTD